MVKKIFRSNLFKTSSIYTIGKFVNSAIPFMLLPILTRYLTIEEYGQLSMFNAMVSFFIPFVGMNIGSAILRKVVEENDKESKEYIYNSLLIFAVSTIFISIVTYFFSDQLSQYTTIPKELFPCVMMTTAGSCLLGVVLSFYQIKNRPRKYFVLQISCTLINVSLSLIFIVIFEMNLPGRIYGITYSALLFGIISIWLLYRFISKNQNGINKNYIKDEIFNFALPLIPIEIKSVVLTYIDRIFLTNMVNVATTGVYSLGNQLSLPLFFIEQAFNLAFVPWLFKNLEKNNEIQKRKIVKMTYFYFIIVSLAAFLLSMIAKPLISIITDSGYEEAHIYVLWLSLGYAFIGMQMMVVNYIYYAKKLHLYAPVTFIVLLLNIILNYVLINEYGPIGAAEATLICNMISFLLTWMIAIKVYPMPWLFFRKKNSL